VSIPQDAVELLKQEPAKHATRQMQQKVTEKMGSFMAQVR
jgi:hypothetical protein